MKTLDLVAWKRNENMSNIYVSAVGGDEMFLKLHYAAVFEDCANLLKNAKVSSFVENVWQPICNDACRSVQNAVSNACRSNGVDVDEASVNRIISKFRGNLGEMLVEMLAENGLLDFIKPGTYDPVDPTREEFFDATAKRNGMLVGIQVKNYSTFNKVGLEVFLKAAAQSDLWLRRDQMPSLDMTSPCQYIISMSEAENCLTDRFKGSVVFLGPKWLDGKRITGSTKTKESAKWMMFAEVAEAVNKL